MKARKAKSRYNREQQLAFKRFHAWRGIIAKADSLNYLLWCYNKIQAENLDFYVKSSALHWLSIRKRTLIGQPNTYPENLYLYGPEE